MIESKVIQLGATGVIAVFLGLLIFDAASGAYEVPLPLYGTIGLIFGGGAALGFRSKYVGGKEDQPKDAGDSK